MTNPDDLHSRFSGPSPRKRFVFALSGLVALAMVAYVARPAWRTLKHYRATSFLATAREARAQGNILGALERAQAAFQLRDDDPDILRFNARLLSDLRQERAVDLFERLAFLSQTNLNDKLEFLESALFFQQLQRVGPLFSNLCEQGHRSARLERVGALYSLGVGATNTARAHARQAHGLEPENPTNALLVASLAFPGVEPDVITEARARLREVASTSNSLRVVALRRLVQSEICERSDREWVVELISRAPNSTPEDLGEESVLLDEARIRLDPTLTSTVVSNLVGRVRHDDSKTLTLVVDVLSRLGRNHEVLHLTAGHRSLVNRTVFQARYDALVALGRREDAYRHLLEPDAPVPPYDLALARVKAAVVLRDPSRRDGHLAELVQAAKGDSTRLRTAAELAEHQGAALVAIDAWKNVWSNRVHTSTALRALQRLSDRRGDTWTARDYARKALREGSPIRSLKLEIAYYDLLLGENLEGALSEAEHQANQQPKEFFPRGVVALAHLRLGSPEKARATLERFFVDEPQPRADSLAILAATLGQNGFTVRAREIASRIQIERLRPEERELVKPWIAPPANGPLPSL